MKNFFTFMCLVFCLNNLSFSQGKFIIQNKKQSDKISFKLINNLIVVPVEINGVSLSFLLDTGVTKPLIFNFLNVSDTLRLYNTEKIFIRGLGEGDTVEALKSKDNVFKIGDAIKLNQDLYAINDSNLSFAPRLGIPIHGIIGYDLFKDFVVEINYSKSFIRIVNPEKYKYKTCKKCEKLNLEFYRNKPYINARIKVDNNKIPIKLLIDSGGSDALWLFEDNSLGIKSRDKYFHDFLGHGLSGSVYGKRSKIESFYLKSFELKNVNVAYPDSSYTLHARKVKSRNGSLSGDILKRFNLIIDYKKSNITFKKNSNFKNKFSYNKSGIELAHDGVRLVKEIDNKINSSMTNSAEPSNSTKIVIDTQYKISLKPAYTIVELRNNSPAQKAGLKIGDIILSVNEKQAFNYSLQQLMHLFYAEAGKTIKLKVDRNGVFLTFKFQLEDVFN
ncbi:aspartyl protease family protein [Thalassobellus suaedae]|uniref:Aspartyl protease family protein n=1 Tax=Thalassobellus suaedae TaxID=3074124 RepID=A0ABY9XPV5_9FLAO|nr:aspartyl protease family protein [Flavobacteriaceae bacterium HL-DH14]